MDYPESRETEDVARLCPYCERPFRGKHGVLIHLGQVRGRKDHPESYPNTLNPDEFTVVMLDQHDNIVEVVEEGRALPSTRKRQQAEREQADDIPERVEKYLEKLREEGKEEQAEEARRMLLGNS